MFRTKEELQKVLSELEEEHKKVSGRYSEILAEPDVFQGYLSELEDDIRAVKAQMESDISPC